FQSPRMDVCQFMGVEEMKRVVRECRLVVSHAGIGSILTALTFQKPIVVFPRHASLGEHRNDHQLSTARRFRNRPGVTVVNNPEELFEQLTQGMSLSLGSEISPFASESLTDTIRSFIFAEAASSSRRFDTNRSTGLPEHRGLGRGSSRRPSRSGVNSRSPS
ncbi:MAG: glycosyltransferase, partial [Planctomycetota bacterium]